MRSCLLEPSTKHDPARRQLLGDPPLDPILHIPGAIHCVGLPRIYLTRDWRWCRGVQFCEYPEACGLVFKVIDLVIFHVDLIFAGGKVITVAVFE